MNFDKVLEYIRVEELDCKSRDSFYVFRRQYLMSAIYNTHQFTLKQIGAMFQRDHSTVIHSIRKHEELKSDRLYQKMTDSCAKLLLEPLEFTRQRRNIFDDIAKASNLEKLRRIRRWINEGRYDHQMPKDEPSQENWQRAGEQIKNKINEIQQNI